MPTSIYLPAEEDTEVVITVGGKAEITIDLFDLEDLFFQANQKSEEMNTSWKNEFPVLFKKKTGKDIKPGQAILLWEGVKERIYDLKKSLLEESLPSSEQASPSSRRTRRKRG